MSQEKSQISKPKSQSPKVDATGTDTGLETMLFGLEVPPMPTLSAAVPETVPAKLTVKKEMVEKLVAKVKEL